MLLESFLYQIIRQYFKPTSSNINNVNTVLYTDIIELFQDVVLQTEIGQWNDLTAQPQNSPVDLSRFTTERYKNIVVYKTAYYTFYLSAASAMLLRYT